MTSAMPSQSCIPPTPTNSFSVNDDRAYSWLLFSGFTSGDRIDWEFIDPDGMLHDTYAVVPPPFQPPDGCTWGWMSIALSNVPAGSWYVDVYVNSVYAFTEFFTIAQENPCPIKTMNGENSRETERLRHFRDAVLKNTSVGQDLMRMYYEWSPAIVKVMEADEDFKEEIRAMIDGMLSLLGE